MGEKKHTEAITVLLSHTHTDTHTFLARTCVSSCAAINICVPVCSKSDSHANTSQESFCFLFVFFIKQKEARNIEETFETHIHMSALTHARSHAIARIQTNKILLINI